MQELGGIDVLRAEVHQFLSTQRELCSTFTLLLKNHVSQQEKTFMKRFLKSQQFTFTGLQAFEWLTRAFEEHSLEWKKEHAIHVVEYLWSIRFIDVKELPQTEDVVITEETVFILSSPAQSEIRRLLSVHQVNRIGIAMRKEHYEMQYPVLLVPGIASSSLSVWKSDYCPHWVGERIWLDFSKVGTQIKLPNLWESSDETKKEFGLFVRHMLLADDGYSDPPGIRVRPMEGLEAVASLAPVSRLTSGLTTIFRDLIQNLLDIGYDRRSIAAAPYDWRLPARMLEERDGYFTQLTSKIKNLYKMNGKKRVAMICHSNGNRIFHYFTHWIESKKPGFVKKYIHGLVALGSPYLGAPKMVRVIVTGDALGLDIVIEGKEKEAWGRHMGASPSLLPIQEHLLPSKLLMLYTGSSTMKESKHAFTYQAEPQFPKNNCWEQYKVFEDSIVEKYMRTLDCLELNPYQLAGIWIRDDSSCHPPIPNDDTEYVTLVQDKATRTLLLEILRLIDVKTEEIQTARNGLRINYTLEDSSSFPFLMEQGNSESNCETFLSVDGKAIITTHNLPTDYKLQCISSLIGGGNILHKLITVYKGTKILASLSRNFHRETAILGVRQCIQYDNTDLVGKYSAPSWKSFIARVLPSSYEQYNEFFQKEKYIMGYSDPSGVHRELSDAEMNEYPILCPPLGIENMLCVYGTDMDTEVSYYLAKKPNDDEMLYHTKADVFSNVKCDSNPAGLLIKNGIGYETVNTPQRCLGGKPKSGDGTVPYSSLSHCKNWKEREDLNLDIIEVPNVEHSSMLRNPEVILHVLKYLCQQVTPQNVKN